MAHGEGNVDLALKLRKVPKDKRRARVTELLELVNLTEFAKKRPHELSGGMRQRVALARARPGRRRAVDGRAVRCARRHDATLMHDELERLWTETGLSVLFVTHNVREAVRLGDRVVLLSSRPGHVIAEFPVTEPRPRRIDSVAVATLAAEITDRLKEEVRRHAGDD